MTGPDVRTPPARGANAEDKSTENDRILADGETDRKAFATASAKAALVGCSLHELASGGYLLARWAVCRELPDLRAVNAMLARMGVQ